MDRAQKSDDDMMTLDLKKQKTNMYNPQHLVNVWQLEIKDHNIPLSDSYE